MALNLLLHVQKLHILYNESRVGLEPTTRDFFECYSTELSRIGIIYGKLLYKSHFSSIFHVFIIESNTKTSIHNPDSQPHPSN